MHELSVMKNILSIVLGHAARNSVEKVVKIHLDVGELSDVQEEWMQRYFNYLSEGTVAEGSLLAIQWIPVTMRCSGCGAEFNIDAKLDGEIGCPACGGEGCEVVAGKGYSVKSLEVI